MKKEVEYGGHRDFAFPVEVSIPDTLETTASSHGKGLSHLSTFQIQERSKGAGICSTHQVRTDSSGIQWSVTWDLELTKPYLIFLSHTLLATAEELQHPPPGMCISAAL